MDPSLHLFFDGWGPLLRIVVVGTLSYVALLLMLRVSGMRTLARMNAFDFAITVALGTTFGRLLTAEDMTLVEALVAFSLLISLHLASTYLAARSRLVDHALGPQPVLVVYRGEFLRGSMRRERITRAEILATLRENGIGGVEEVEAVTVERNGQLSVVARSGAGSGSAIEGPGDGEDGVRAGARGDRSSRSP